jgi:hypothetical protein
MLGAVGIEAVVGQTKMSGRVGILYKIDLILFKEWGGTI